MSPRSSGHLGGSAVQRSLSVIPMEAVSSPPQELTTVSRGSSTLPRLLLTRTKHRRARSRSSPSPTCSTLSKSRTGASGCVRKVSCAFAGDLPEQEQRLVWATHYAPAADLFSRNAPGVAWKSKPSWYIVANNDRTVHPDLERFLAKRMGATTRAIDSSHVAMLSHPDVVIDVIRAAARAVQSSTAAAGTAATSSRGVTVPA